jgi:hypothetical protein
MNEIQLKTLLHLYYYYKYLFARKLRAILNLKNQEYHYVRVVGTLFLFKFVEMENMNQKINAFKQ